MQLNYAITISFTHFSYCGRPKDEMVPAQRLRADVEDDGGDCADVDAGREKKEIILVNVIDS